MSLEDKIRFISEPFKIVLGTSSGYYKYQTKTDPNWLVAVGALGFGGKMLGSYVSSVMFLTMVSHYYYNGNVSGLQNLDDAFMLCTSIYSFGTVMLDGIYYNVTRWNKLQEKKKKELKLINDKIIL